MVAAIYLLFNVFGANINEGGKAHLLIGCHRGRRDDEDEGIVPFGQGAVKQKQRSLLIPDLKIYFTLKLDFSAWPLAGFEMTYEKWCKSNSTKQIVLWFANQPPPTLPAGRQVPLMKGERFS
jgi:hypothetical protein